MTDRTELARTINRLARLEGSFTLRSGAVSDTYFDKYRFEAEPRVLRAIGEAMVPLIPDEATVLAGLEMGGIPIVTLLGQLTGLPIAFLRKAAKTYGTCRYAEGAELAGAGVVLIEDVVSSGGAILNNLDMLEADRPLAAVCVIDREAGGREALAARGVPLRALLTMTEIDQA